MALSNTAKFWTPPIKFTVPGGDPDASIKIFHQEFQVHSKALTRKSTVLRRELAFAKSAPTRRGNRLTYEWVTTINADGSWYLTPCSKISKNVRNLSPAFNNAKLIRSLFQSGGIFVGDMDEEITAFNKFLCVIYSWPFTIHGLPQLKLLVKLADFYKILLALSAHAAFYVSPLLAEECFNHPVEILELAVKLRHPVLYRECLTQCMAPWDKPRYLQITDQTIRTIAETFHRRITRLIAQAQRDLLRDLAALEPSLRKFDSNMPWTGLSIATNGSQILVLPSFYEKCYECPISDAGMEFKEALKLAVEKRLQSGITDDKEKKLGKESYFDMPLYLEIDDKELPWDSREKSW